MINIEYLREANNEELAKAKGKYIHILEYDDGIMSINNDSNTIFKQTREVNNEDHNVVFTFINLDL